MTTQRISFETKSASIRNSIEAHREWIEAQIGMGLAEAVILEIVFPLGQVAIEKLLGYANKNHSDADRAKYLMERAEYIDFPSGSPIRLDMSWGFSSDFTHSNTKRAADDPYSLTWQDMPVALRLRDVAATVVALRVEYIDAPASQSQENVQCVIVPKTAATRFLRVLEESRRTDSQPRLYVNNAFPRPIASCDWDQLVLDPSIKFLLKDDFESFFKRKAWFQSMRLPFRRGYLFHGAPGNGKSTAVRAMLTSQGLSAYTMRLFAKRAEDDDLDALFTRAEQNRPSVILLEDLDRAFPRTGQSRSNVSLQQLLNNLDGVGTGEGIIVIATANEPAILDAAILRRPGRFDRVVHFPNPAPELRREYFLRLQPNLQDVDLGRVVSSSDGFSFAYLREAYILAGQRAFEDNRDINLDDLQVGIEALRGTMRSASAQSTQSGFRTSVRLSA